MEQKKFDLKELAKILFWINTGTMNIFGLSKYLKNELDSEFYAIYDTPEKPKKFFQTQKLVDFKKIWFYNDNVIIDEKVDLDYLKEFEEKYKINLWQLASTERIFLYNEFYKFSDQEINSILEKECKFFENVIDEVNPNHIIMVKPYFHHEMIFFQLCKAKGIKVLELDVTRFPLRCSISFSENKEKYEQFEIQNEPRSFDELSKYRKNNSSISQDTDFQSTGKNFLDASLKYIFSDNSTLDKNYKYFGRSKIKVLLNYIYDRFRVKNRKKFLDKYFLKEFSINKKYILFTLSVEAENAILFDAPFYINQVEVVKNIAKALPAEFILLVKEHPASGVRSWRSTEVYQELMDIPNVVPIHYSANTEELIKKSSLVISICSSSSLDALFLRKPTIIFGNTDFSMISDVKKIEEIEKLPEIIKNELKREINPYNLEKYIQFIEENSFEYNMVLHGQIMQKYLYHGSLLTDVEITEDKMNLFLEETKTEFEKLKNAYLKFL